MAEQGPCAPNATAINQHLINFPDDLITPKQAARLLRCHLATIHRWIQTGKIPAWRRGSDRYLVSEADVLAKVQAVRPTVALPAVSTRAMQAEERRVNDVLRRFGLAK